MSDFRPQAEHAASGHRGHESYDFRFKGILVSAVALGAVALIVHVGLGFAMEEFRKIHRREQARRPAILRDQRGQFPPPNLQPTPRLDMDRFRDREMHQLNSYGWTDEHSRLAHIPIERAMSLLVEKGLPTRDPVGQGRKTVEAP